MDEITSLLNDCTVKEEIINTSEQNLMDFIQGVNTDVSGEIQICSVADYYCPLTEKASALSAKFSEAVCAYDGNADLKYNYYYDDKERKARYIFFGEPGFIIKAMEILKQEWSNLTDNQSLFTGKADQYLKGRPDYPLEFMDYLYKGVGLKRGDVVADIGSGVGNVSRLFLDRGHKVYCVEPNREMRIISDSALGHFKHYVSLAKTGEDTGIKTGSVDFIFCGNAYDYFDRHLAKPEFNRILKKGGKVIIAYYGPKTSEYSEELEELLSRYGIESKKRDYSEAFAKGNYEEKLFENAFMDDYEGFVAGCLSHSKAPKPGHVNYEHYLKGLDTIFNKYQVDGKVKTVFRLRCLVGDVQDLIV